MGMRAIRFSLQNKVIFRSRYAQCSARESSGELCIMFPMIASLDEFEEARKMVLECIGALQYEGIEHNKQPRIGMMIEIPSVLDLIDDFAKTADFFSIGTNDLIQYMLAVDRTNETVAGLYQPYHPAVLRAMKKIIDSAQPPRQGGFHLRRHGARGAASFRFLSGAGFRTLSVEPLYLPKVQKVVMQIDLNEAQKKGRDDAFNEQDGKCRTDFGGDSAGKRGTQ